MGASATYGDDKLRAGAATATDTIVDKVHRLRAARDSSTVPDGSLASQRVHALSDVHAVSADRGRVARVENPDHQPPDNLRVKHHRGVSRTPVALLSAHHQRCCTSVQSPQTPSLTSVGLLTSLTAVGPDCSGTFESAPFPPRSLSSAGVCALQMCTRDRFHWLPAALLVYQSKLTAHTPKIMSTN